MRRTFRVRCLHKLSKLVVPVTQSQGASHANRASKTTAYILFTLMRSTAELIIRSLNLRHFGGVANSMSLAQLSAWCATHFGPREIATDPNPRPFDIPWMVLDTARAAKEWRPTAARPRRRTSGRRSSDSCPLRTASARKLRSAHRPRSPRSACPAGERDSRRRGSQGS